MSTTNLNCQLLSTELFTKINSILIKNNCELLYFLEAAWIFITSKFIYSKEINCGRINAKTFNITEQSSLYSSQEVALYSLQLNTELSLLNLTHKIQEGVLLDQVDEQITPEFIIFHHLQFENSSFSLSQNDGYKLLDASKPAKIDCPLLLFSGENKIFLDIYNDQDWQIKEMLESYCFLFANILDLLEKPLAELTIVSPKQWEWLKKWNETDWLAKNSHHQNIPQRIHEIVLKQPASLAIISTTRCLTYAEMEQLADGVAKKLITLGVDAKHPIALLGTRGWQLAVILLGILKTGVPYLFLNAYDPAERTLKILTESNANLVLVEDINKINSISTKSRVLEIGTLTNKINDNKEEYFDENLCSPSSIAYLMYTSGSTGQPKGVAISHAAVLNTLDDMRTRLILESSDRILSLSSLGFDLSVFDLFGSFISGAAVVLLDENDSKNPQAWAQLIETYRITIWNSVPALLALLVEYYDTLTSDFIEHIQLRWILLSGDLIPPTLPAQIKKYVSPNCRIFALGGSTEASIWSIGHEVTDWNTNATLPYGRPLHNQKIYIVDDNKLPLPPGAIGEILIAGKGLAECYWANPLLTEFRFSTLPMMGRVFHCRDRGRINVLSSLAEFMGRLDRQTKVQGNRIDLTEIEQHLGKIDAIELAVVTTLKNVNDQVKLIAILKNKASLVIPSDEQIRNYLMQILSPAMIPNHYFWIEKWPLTENGKIDFQKLIKNVTAQLSNTQQIPKLPAKKSIQISENLLKKSLAPLAANQKGMWYEIIKGNSSTYSFSVALHYAEQLDPKKVETAWQKLVDDISALRQSFSSQETQVYIHASFDVPYYYFNWSNINAEQIEQWLKSRHNELMMNGFDLFRVPLFCIEHFCLNNSGDKLVIYCNHLLFDAISTTFLIEKFHTLYEELINNTSSQLKNAKLAMSLYSDFLHWRNMLDTSIHREFWQQELLRLEVPSLITNISQEKDTIMNSEKSLPANIFIKLSEKEKLQLYHLCEQHHLSVVSFLQSCWSLLLAFWLDQSQVISGLVYSGRNNLPHEWKNIVGFFINTLPLILDISPDLSFITWVKQNNDKIQQVKKHEVISLEEINHISKVSDHFDSVFTAFNFSRPGNSPSLTIKKIEYDQVTHFPLTVQFDPSQMEIRLLFLPSYLKSELQLLISESYQWLITQALLAPNRRLKEFTLHSIQSNRFYPYAINYGKTVSYDFDITYAFERQAKTNPNQLACVCGSEQFTYSQLISDVQKVSAYLKNQKNISPVAIFLPRSYSFIVVVMACLDVCIPFIPVGLDWPIDYLLEKLQEINCRHVIVEKIDEILTVNPVLKFHQYAEMVNSKIVPLDTYQTSVKNNLAYILFTSGSTGRPKGVKIPRSALNNNIPALAEALQFSRNQVWLSITQTTFDILFLEILIPLCFGGVLLFPTDSELDDPSLLRELMLKYSPNYLQTTPSRWQLLLQQKLPLESLRILVGGEALSQGIFNLLCNLSGEVINLYGPTEATIWTTLAKLKTDDIITIGSPIANTWCAVINRYNQILPNGVIGELCIGGSGLAVGYVDHTQTEALFITLPMASGNSECVYKTGDNAWIDNNQRIHFLGRHDRQLKIRGQRIDPVAIENVINTSGLVKNAIVISSPHDRQALLACLQLHKHQAKPMKFSLFCFPEQSSNQCNPFIFYQTLAKQADQLNLHGMWLPERHFDVIGAPFSAPSVVAGALVSSTEKLVIGAGSVVLPLHNPIAIIEQWSTLDCLSRGRVRLSVASGWHPNDFILAPENYKERKKILFEKLQLLKEGWEKGQYQDKNGIGEMRTVSLFPRPIQTQCPLWISIADDIDTFIQAGCLGLHILTHLLIQNVNELANKVKVYRLTLSEHGHDPSLFHVAVMIHTYVHPAQEIARDSARAPLMHYFRSHLHLLTKMQHESTNDQEIPEEYFHQIVNRFIETKSLIGTPQQCETLLMQLQQADVNEIACLVDFGLPNEKILQGLKEIASLQLKLPSLFYQEDVDLEELRNILSKKLPPIMIPNDFIIIDEIPLTAHGKIDYQDLNKIIGKRSLASNQTVVEKFASVDPLTQKVVDLWKTVLNRNEINIKLSFFDQGGHSLRAIELINLIEENFNIQVPVTHFLTNPWIEALITVIRQGVYIKYERPILSNTKRKQEGIEEFPLTHMQKGIWIFNRLFPDAISYHDAFLYEVIAPINVDDLLKTINMVLAEEFLFKIFFTEKHGEVVQRIGNKLAHAELKQYEREINNNPLEDTLFFEELNAFIKKPFDLTQPPLLRIVIYQFANKLYLQLVLHHLITDGRSLFNIIHRIENLLKNFTMNFDELPSYLDYTLKLNSNSVSHVDYRQHLINDYLKTMGLSRLQNTLKNTHKPSIKRTFKGFQRYVTFSGSFLEDIKKLAYTSTTTINNILLTAFIKTLLNFINEEKIQIGLPISLRENNWQECIGLFINFGVMAVTRLAAETWDIETWINEIKLRSTFLLENRTIPFADLAHTVSASLLTESHPLFQFVFNATDTNISLTKVFRRIPMDYRIARFDLELQAESSMEEIAVTFIYSQDVFSQDIADNFLKEFQEQLLWLISKFTHEKIKNYWHSIFDGMYKNIEYLDDLSTWSGWNNSIDGQPFSVEAMHEWLQDIITKLKRRSLGRVLEIGCGTGAIMKAFANEYTSYLGIDISATIIEKLASVYQTNKTHFITLNADELEQLAPQSFDTIIINSVVQYLTNLEHLRKIIGKTIALINRNGGRIILGDLRNEWYQDVFYQYIHERRTNNRMNSEDLKLYRQVEKELFANPQFFYQLPQYFPTITAILVEPKYMQEKNELSYFRFDVTLEFSSHRIERNQTINILDGSEINSANLLLKLISNYKYYADNNYLCIINLYNNKTDHFDIKIHSAKFQQIIKSIGMYGWVLFHPKDLNQFIVCLSNHSEPPSYSQIMSVFEKLAEAIILPDKVESLIESNFIQLSTIRLDITSQLTQIWQRLLQREQINLTDNFLALGGDSLLYVKLFSEVTALGYSIKMTDLLSRQTLSEQVDWLNTFLQDCVRTGDNGILLQRGADI